jgi:hypothetical protein
LAIDIAFSLISQYSFRKIRKNQSVGKKSIGGEGRDEGTVLQARAHRRSSAARPGFKEIPNSKVVE